MFALEVPITEEAIRRRQKWIGSILGMLLFAGALNVWITLSCLPKFQILFRDAMGDYPLPGLTQWILDNRSLLIILAAIWPLSGLVIAWRQKVESVLCLYLPWGLGLAQTLLTVLALFLPMWEMSGVLITGRP